MNKEELHKFIEEKQPNICQIVAYKDNKKVYSDYWNKNMFLEKENSYG